MFKSMSETRRVRIQIESRTTEELIATRERLLKATRDDFQNSVLEVVEEALSKRADFLPVK